MIKKIKWFKVLKIVLTLIAILTFAYGVYQNWCDIINIFINVDCSGQ